MSKKTIGLTGAFEATDKHGTPWLVQSLSIEAKGYIPDVRVQLHLPYQTALPDDEIFLAQVMAQLHKIGYEGEPFGRAELGMQGPDYVMLEPSRGFRAFAKTLGWQDLAESDPLPWALRPGAEASFQEELNEARFSFRLRYRDGNWMASDNAELQPLLSGLQAELERSGSGEPLAYSLEYPSGFAQDSKPWVDLLVSVPAPAPAQATELQALGARLKRCLQPHAPAGLAIELKECTVSQTLRAVRTYVAFRAEASAP